MKFGVGEGSKKSLPEPLLGHFPSEDLRIGILRFLQGYYEKYDGDKRSALLDMYAEDATLTLCVSSVAQDVHQKVAKYDDSYFKISRNLIRVKEDERRKKMVHHGKLQAVSVLDRLPKTEHFLESFRVDIMYHNSATILFNFNGVYRETVENARIVRVFNRTMQVNAPSTIKTDNLIISHASLDLIKKYKESPVTSTTSPSRSVTSPQEPSNSRDLISLMMQQTGMNEEFSRQCLTDYNFDFTGAMDAFQSLRAANKIPPEAFS